MFAAAPVQLTNGNVMDVRLDTQNQLHVTLIINGRGLIRGSGYKDSGTPHVLPKHFDSLSLTP